MDAIAFLTVVGGIIGIIAGSVQVLDYVEKRREKPSKIELVSSTRLTPDSAKYRSTLFSWQSASHAT
jgi:hypothetical protein